MGFCPRKNGGIPTGFWAYKGALEPACTSFDRRPPRAPPAAPLPLPRRLGLRPLHPSRVPPRLRLSPSMAAVTPLSHGNGAPDAFASAAALGGPGGMPRAGLAAILSAGAFISAFVVGVVALIAAPFAVLPASFTRDSEDETIGEGAIENETYSALSRLVLSVGFELDFFLYRPLFLRAARTPQARACLLAASGLFYIYLSVEIFLWQAVGLVLFYVFFVGLVFYM
ncbi:hypothetical protein BAE44_0022986 [Dichanthelium oligosanthes]|uniref:Uncharacterized protein n=1 Tax=Dichanthelium oligosanthes TaxID=888268 RepID=A0A1E5UT73_9POAL|nr:hypothetical protein BAE44_0022986 [Dichanthelium oligosanthes]